MKINNEAEMNIQKVWTYKSYLPQTKTIRYSDLSWGFKFLHKSRWCLWVFVARYSTILQYLFYNTKKRSATTNELYFIQLCLINFWNAHLHAFLLSTSLWDCWSQLRTDPIILHQELLTFVYSASNLTHRFWTNSFVHHITVNLSYQAANDVGLDFIAFKGAINL